MQFRSSLAVIIGCLIACQLLPAAEADSCYARLFANDPLRFGIDFRTARFGLVFQESEVRNYNTDLRFGVDGPNVLAAGPQGGEEGFIADITALGLSFESVQYVNQTIVAVSWNRTSNSFDYAPLPPPIWNGTLAAFPVSLYLANISDAHDGWWRLVKFYTTELTNLSSVWIRWEVLFDNEEAGSTPFICQSNLGSQGFETDMVPVIVATPTTPPPITLPPPTCPPPTSASPPSYAVPHWLVGVIVLYGVLLLLLLLLVALLFFGFIKPRSGYSPLNRG